MEDMASASVSAVAGNTVSAVAGNTTVSAVAGSGAPDAVDIGTVRQAMAWRVKYRVKSESGQTKRRLPLQMLGVHPQNRGGVYPQGNVVKTLGIRLAGLGYSQEDADHQGVAVEQPPRDEKNPDSAVAESYGEYNRRKCLGQPLLKSCFGVESNVTFGMLSHNHLLLLLLCWTNSAKWELEDKEQGLLGKALNAEGRLDVDTAVAADGNFAELKPIVTQGLLVEVLSWKINVEEPGACSVICAALNAANQVALRTTELTAIAVLSGECALHSSLACSDSIDFLKVKAACRSKLDCFVDEPEFQELFSFVINLGADNGPFIPDLLDFGSRFVDQRIRQLRLHAFAEINKVSNHCPRTKIAALKRAYHKKPSHGLCPSPDSKFHTATFDSLLRLEELLQYFHSYCKPAYESVMKDDYQRAKFIANVDCAAADAFVSARDNATLPELSLHMLQATKKYNDQLQAVLPAEIKEKRLAWIRFPIERKANTNPASAVAESKLLPKIIRYDPVSGEVLTTQETRVTEKRPAPEFQYLPWRSWHQRAASSMGMEEAATRAAWQVLYLLHARTNYSDVPLDVVMDMSKNHRCVKATQVVPPEQLLLAPCVLKAKSLSLNSVHPSRATIEVVLYRQFDEFPSSVDPKPKTKRRKIAKEDAVAGGSDENAGADSKEAAGAGGSDDSAGADSKEALVAVGSDENAGADSKKAAVAGGSDGQAGILKSFRFYVNPEWKAPEADHDDPESWNWQNDESMHPYWSVRRLSHQRLGEATFNMTTKPLEFTVATVGAVSGEYLSVLMKVTVPFMTNYVEIPKGAELLLEEEDKQRKEKQKSKTWKDDVYVRSRGSSGGGGSLAGATRKATKVVVEV